MNKLEDITSQTTLTILRYQKGDEDKILDLLRITLGETPVIKPTQEFWQWKHLDNPFGRSYGIYAFDPDQNKVAGLRMLMHWKFINAGKEVQAVRAVDTATHPGYQRRGIFSSLTKRAIKDLTDEGVQFIFNTPNEKSLPGYLKMGWKIVAKVPLYIRILRPVRFLRNTLVKSGEVRELPVWNEYFGEGVLPWNKFEEQYRSRITELIRESEEGRQQGKFRTCRDFGYLQWRYGRHPHLQYGVYTGEEGGVLRGFAILKPNLRYGMKEVAITELFCGRADAAEKSKMIRAAAASIKADYLIASFAAGSTDLDALKRSSFHRLPRKGLTFTARVLNSPRSNPMDFTNWDLTLGDLEMF